MRKKYGLWFMEIVLCILVSLSVFFMYPSMNIFTLYGVLFAPALITAFVYLYLIKRKKIDKMWGYSLYASSTIFSFIAMIVFAITDIVLRAKSEIYEIIVFNTRAVLDEEYLIIKENSNLMDYIFIFVFIFLIFWFIGKGNKMDERKIEH